MLKALDHDTFAISHGRPPAAFLKHCVLVTQSDIGLDTPFNIGSVKQLISSPNSSPSFAFVDRKADLKAAALCILEARFAFNGCSPYAPNVVFVHEGVQNRFTEHLLQLANTLPALRYEETRKAKAESQKTFPSKEEKGDVEVLFTGRKGRIVLVKNR
jgi:hypothetical protein